MEDQQQEQAASRREAWPKRSSKPPFSSSGGSSKILRCKSDCGVSTTMRRLMRMRSLTDADFEELQGCLDLGFHFGVEQQPPAADDRLYDTLPALEVCHAVSRQLSSCSSSSSSSDGDTPDPSPSWSVKMPGDEAAQEQMKNMRHWAKAVGFISRQQLTKAFFSSNNKSP